MKLLIILIIITTTFVIFNKHKEHNNVTNNDTSSYKFYLSILMLFHHLALQTNLFCFREFKHWGGIIVGNFLFISGYGLMASYKKQGNNYFDKFLKKRLLKIYIPFIVATIAFVSLSYLGLYKQYNRENIILYIMICFTTTIIGTVLLKIIINPTYNLNPQIKK